jgi:peptidyl-prolyl cis-trans isomerase A (cyclophilin A)
MTSFKNISSVKPIRRFPILIILGLILTGFVACNRSTHKTIQIKTDLGDITVEIYPDLAPITASNFLSLVENKTYTNALFYRVVRLDNQPQSQVKIEVIQGGLFDDDLVESHTPIEHENTEITGIKHTDGVISMARMEPGSASTEFFICIGDQPSLDFDGTRNPDGQGFAAFGKVVVGMDVVRNIQSLRDEGQYLPEKVIIQEIFILP